jgi:Rhodopirellula transposase DDE domain
MPCLVTCAAISISLNWHAKLLTSLETVIELNSPTATKEGLQVTAIKDSQAYPTGITVTMRNSRHSTS